MSSWNIGSERQLILFLRNALSKRIQRNPNVDSKTTLMFFFNLPTRAFCYRWRSNLLLLHLWYICNGLCESFNGMAPDTALQVNWKPKVLWQNQGRQFEVNSYLPKVMAKDYFWKTSLCSTNKVLQIFEYRLPFFQWMPGRKIKRIL